MSARIPLKAEPETEACVRVVNLRMWPRAENGDRGEPAEGSVVEVAATCTHFGATS